MGDRSHNRHGPRIGWGLCPFFRGSWVPIEHKVAWTEAYTSIPNGILVHLAFGHNGHWPKIGGCAPLGEGDLDPHGTWVPIYHKVAWAEAYLHTKWHLNPSSHFATRYVGRKLGAEPLWGRGLGPHLTQCGQGRGLPACQVTS